MNHEHEGALSDRVKAVLADPGTWADPPEGLVDRVLAEGKRRESLGHSLWIAASLALVLVGLALFLKPEDAGEEGLTIAMTGTPLAPDATGTAFLREAASGWYIRLDVDGLPPAPEDSFYQGWLWGDGEGISIGTFHMRNGPEPVGLWSGVSPEGFPVVRVTLQEVSGGPSASDRVVMEGRVDGSVR